MNKIKDILYAKSGGCAPPATPLLRSPPYTDRAYSSPGHAQDADLLYGSQQSANPSSNTGRLSGEGSHFGNARDDTAGVARSASRSTYIMVAPLT